MFEFDVELDCAITKVAADGWSSIELTIEKSELWNVDNNYFKIATLPPWMAQIIPSGHFGDSPNPFPDSNPGADGVYESSYIGRRLRKLRCAGFSVTFIQSRPGHHLILSWEARQLGAAVSVGESCTDEFQKAVSMKIVSHQVKVLFRCSEMSGRSISALPCTAKALVYEFCSDGAQLGFLGCARFRSLTSTARPKCIGKFCEQLCIATLKMAEQGLSSLEATVEKGNLIVRSTGGLDHSVQGFMSWMMPVWTSWIASPRTARLSWPSL